MFQANLLDLLRAGRFFGVAGLQTVSLLFRTQERCVSGIISVFYNKPSTTVSRQLQGPYGLTNQKRNPDGLCPAGNRATLIYKASLVLHLALIFGIYLG